MITFVTTAVRALARQSSLPVFELHPCDVETPNTWLRSPDGLPTLRHLPGCPPTQAAKDEVLTGWRLATAVVKADHVRATAFPRAAAVGFLLEQLGSFDWGNSNLRLTDGEARRHAEFVGTDLSGRIGQGITLLAMESRGYLYVQHYKRKDEEGGPDFIVECPTTGIKARVESKGSFVRPDATPPDIKGRLREALQQARDADPQGTTKSYGVTTFVRERQDSSTEPSLVALVDPDDPFEEPLRHEPDSVMRANYSAWLGLMGLRRAASDLRARARHEASDGILLGAQIGGELFALSVLGILPGGGLPPRPYDAPWHWYGSYLVAGLPASVMRSINVALNEPSTQLAIDRDLETPGSAHRDGPYAFEGSVLADGCLMGLLPAREVFRLGPLDLHL